MKNVRLRNRSGLSFPELIWAIVIIGAIALGLLAFFGVGALRNAALIDVADVKITGPGSLIVDGSPGTYTVTVELAEEVSSRVSLQVRISEDDLGPDELLDSLVQVDIVTGSKSGTGTFTLRCVNEDNFGPDDEILEGEDGKDPGETGTLFEIYGEVVPDNTVQGGTGTTLKEVRCRRLPTDGQ